MLQELTLKAKLTRTVGNLTRLSIRQNQRSLSRWRRSPYLEAVLSLYDTLKQPMARQ